MPQADLDPWQRLAYAVTTRRTALGLTQAQVTAAGGPSVATMRLIEGALQQNYRSNILGRLEKALLWSPGSINRILDGGQPTEIGETRPQPAPASNLDAELESIARHSPNAALRSWARSLIADLDALRDAARNERAS